MRNPFPWLTLLVLVGTAQAGGLPTYQIDVSDGVFTPPRLEVPAGQRFKIIVRNVGQGPIEFESTPLRVEKVLSPGAQSFVVVHPLKPGRYPFFDEFRMDLPEGEIIAR